MSRHNGPMAVLVLFATTAGTGIVGTNPRKPGSIYFHDVINRGRRRNAIRHASPTADICDRKITSTNNVHPKDDIESRIVRWKFCDENSYELHSMWQREIHHVPGAGALASAMCDIGDAGRFEP